MCRIRFAEDVGLISGSNGELHDLTIRPVDRATVYRMEVSTEKRMIRTNSANKIKADISMNGQRLK